MDFLGTRARWVLAAIIVVGGWLRFDGLAWGAPFHHFHIDEHFVFVGADLLRESMRKAAMNPKFFIYAPLPMYLVNVVRAVYEWVMGPLNLVNAADARTYMLMGRGLSAALGTATIPVVYYIAKRVAGPMAGLLSAAFLALSVLHLRDSHFFTVDISLVFFCMVTLAASLSIAEHGKKSAYIVAGLALGASCLCKYTAVFLLPLIAVAHVCSPRRPRTLQPWQPWVRWALVGIMPVVTGTALFLALDPMVFLYFAKFRYDVRTEITGPILGGLQPLWNAHFRDVHPQLYWFVNLLPWGVGPALAFFGLAGIVWMLTRKNRLALVAASYPIAYFLVAGQTVTPFIRYSIPLVPALAFGAGILGADLLNRPRWRRPAMAAVAFTVIVTGGWALAYTSIFRSADVRLEAAQYLVDTVPKNASILVEPSHNIPPTGQYLTASNFYADYVGWGPDTVKTDYYALHTLDVYRYLYSGRITHQRKQEYIAERLARADYILMDDTFLEFYAHLPDAEHREVKQYYRDLFDGRLGFRMVRSFTRRPSIFGLEINDDSSELTFTLFDHPEIYLFERVDQPRAGSRAD